MTTPAHVTETTPQPSPAPASNPRRKKKVAAGIAAVAIVVAVVAAALFGLSHGKPSTSALREFVASALAAQNQPLSIVKFDRSYKGDSDSGQALFAGEVELTEPRYVKVDTPTYLQSEFGVTLPTVQSDLAILKSRIGARVREVVGGTPPTVPLGDIVLVKQPVRIGTRLRLSGSVRATHVGSLWQFDLVSLQVTPSLPGGDKRPAGTAVYDVSDLIEQGRLRQLVTSSVDYASKIKAARPTLETEIEKDRQERMAQFAQLMRPGALWLGTAIGSQNETYKLVLETTDCSAKTNTVSAVLRNDGGWSDARGFTGQWSIADIGERCSLSLQSRSTQRIENAGPLLESSETWTLEGELTPAGIFDAKSGRWQFHFQRVPEAEQAATRTSLTAPLTRVLASTSPGAMYHGAAISKITHVSEPVLLRFDEQEADGSLVKATLLSAAHEAWKRRFQGTVVISRFRTGDAPLRLRSETVDRADSADRYSALGFTDNVAVGFKIDGEQLVGEDSHYTFRLERADAAWVAKYEAARAARSARFLSLIKPGAAYDGAAKDDRGMVGRLRLRIIEVDPSEGVVTASFESREQYSVYHRMTGSFDVGTGLLQLGSSGLAKSDPTGILRVPIFTSTGTQRVTLQLDDDALNGKIENQGWSMTFALASVATTLPEAELPSQSGAYVLVDGHWHPLPRNNGHTAFAAPQILGGVLNALHAWDSRIPAGQKEDSDQSATLIFDGNVAPPAVSRDALVIAYIGETVPPPLALRQKYSEVRDYPAMELARLQLSRDGHRETTLLKIAPGFTGFGNTRVAAALSQPRADATILRCTGPLEPGAYAVAIGSAAFEVQVK